jgi:hypothetical protein
VLLEALGQLVEAVPPFPGLRRTEEREAVFRRAARRPPGRLRARDDEGQERQGSPDAPEQEERFPSLQLHS